MLLTSVTGAGTHALIWSTAEINVAVICASLLVMKPLLSRFFPSLMGSGRSSAAVDNSRRIKRWSELVRNRINVENEDLEPDVLVLDKSQEDKTRDEEEARVVVVESRESDKE